MFLDSGDIFNGCNYDTAFIKKLLSRASDYELITDYIFFKSIDDSCIEYGDGVYTSEFIIMFSLYCDLLLEEMAKRFYNHYIFQEVF